MGIKRPIGEIHFAEDIEFRGWHPDDISGFVEDQIGLAVVVQISSGIVVQNNIGLPDLVFSYSKFVYVTVLGVVPAEFVIVPTLGEGREILKEGYFRDF